MSATHTIVTLALSLSLTFAQRGSAAAVVWANKDAEPPTEQTGVLRHAGRLLYSRLQVCGGTCVWIGSKWVLTSRHGIANWSAKSLAVSFPAHDKKAITVKRIHVPPNVKHDIALLELQHELDFPSPPTLVRRALKPATKLKFGGYGKSGPIGNFLRIGVFHWGSNHVDTANRFEARFSMSKPSTTNPGEALPCIFDSGSPAFLVHNNRELLAGIIVRVSHRMSPGIGDHAVLTSVAGMKQWLDEVADDLTWNK